MSLSIPAGNFKAYLFDCDGTVVDSMPLHYIAWSRALGEHGCPFPEELFYAWGGRPIREIIASLNQQHGLNMPVALTAERKEEFYVELLPQLKAVEDVLYWVNEGFGRIPMAIVSGSTRDSVEASLNTLGILDRFDTLVCAGDYTHSKPHPEPFLLAAERLGVAPADCLVFEDTDMGIESAIAGGMASVRVPQPHERAAQAGA